MQIYSKEELEYIEKIEKKNDLLEEFFNQKRSEWTDKLSPLFETVKIRVSREVVDTITETQSLTLIYRQEINDQISKFLSKRSKQDIVLKRLKQEKFIYYSTGFPIKTNTGEKMLLIDAHLSEENRNIELIENYIEFLRQMSKNLESLQYTFKNIIDLHNLLYK